VQVQICADRVPRVVADMVGTKSFSILLTSLQAVNSSIQRFHLCGAHGECRFGFDNLDPARRVLL
jgi:hypothetical protein